MRRRALQALNALTAWPYAPMCLTNATSPGVLGADMGRSRPRDLAAGGGAWQHADNAEGAGNAHAALWRPACRNQLEGELERSGAWAISCSWQRSTFATSQQGGEWPLHQTEGASKESEASTSAAAQPLGRIQPRLAMAFTCTICDTRSVKSFSRQAYDNGVVLVRRPATLRRRDGSIKCLPC
jgi:hypothetical protein